MDVEEAMCNGTLKETSFGAGHDFIHQVENGEMVLLC